jgi:hypothetical protein
VGFGKAGFEGAELGLRPFAERAQRILADGARQSGNCTPPECARA